MGNRLDSHLYERLFGAFPTALAVVDPRLAIVHSNRAFRELFSVSVKDVIGRSITKFLPRATINDLASEADKERKSKEAELEITFPKGESGFFKTIVIPFRMESDCASLFLMTLEDITERVRLEEQLLQAEKLSAMGQMAASIAHELGNPLGIMITCLEYLRRSLSRNSELQKEIEVMRDNAERMHELLTGLADMSGIRRFQLGEEDLHRAIIPVLSFVGRMAEKSGITVKTDFASELPPCCIDVRHMKQVFLNLLKNAIEATPSGGTIHVRSRYCPYPPVSRPAAAGADAPSQTGSVSEKTGCVIVEVEDSGKGIPLAELESIFRPFYSTKKRGMGLGLTLCRGIIERHGGKIWATSQEGKGSCFVVEIPVGVAL